MSQLVKACHDALSEGGALAQTVEGFTPRAAQQCLTSTIAQAFEDRDILLAEAGTGTGKTFAYLVPTLLSGLKVIISTGTRALQDQLYHRDLPRVRNALGTGVKTALLKGRANYLCRYRLELTKGEGRFTTREQSGQFQRIVAWAGRTQFGDMAELSTLEDDSPLLPQVTSTAENCLGSECPFWSECFVVQARQRAQAADLVVVNHHLLLADLALKQEGFGEILPGAQAFVIDEAHQLPELAANFFGEGFGMRQLQELARDCLSECKEVVGSLASVQAPVRELEQVLRKLRAEMEGLPSRGTRSRILNHAGVQAGFDELVQVLAGLLEVLRPLRESSAGFGHCTDRVLDLVGRLNRWLGREPAEVEEAVEPAENKAEDETVEVNVDTKTEEKKKKAPKVLDSDVLWFELSARGFRCQRTPLDVSGPLREHRKHSGAAWVFTSATLAVNDDFQHIAMRLGLTDPMTLLQPSPFNWAQQALCYFPPGLPEPNSPGYGAAMVKALYPVFEASNGRAFVLFASHRALREAAEALADAPWPLFVQGQVPRGQLLEQFRASGNGILLGAASFREGVDVVGEALSVVVIDKLPFAAPDDPVFEARLDAVRRQGGNPFRDEQLPQAVIALKQGVGRLIRSESDRGVLVLCDPRLMNKSYGKVFMDSLPPFRKTRDITKAEAFFREDENVGFTNE